MPCQDGDWQAEDIGILLGIWCLLFSREVIGNYDPASLEALDMK